MSRFIFHSDNITDCSFVIYGSYVDVIKKIRFAPDKIGLFAKAKQSDVIYAASIPYITSRLVAGILNNNYSEYLTVRDMKRILRRSSAADIIKVLNDVKYDKTRLFISKY